MVPQVQIRHGPSSQVATVRSLDGAACTDLEVTVPQEDSPAPGQYAALYGEGDECLGAGVISEESWAVAQGPARRPRR